MISCASCIWFSANCCLPKYYWFLSSLGQSAYVGLSFCPFAARIWQKWFSTISWFNIHGLTTLPRKCSNFIYTNCKNPSIIEFRSNHNLSEINAFFAFAVRVSSYHLQKNGASHKWSNWMSFIWWNDIFVSKRLDHIISVH